MQHKNNIIPQETVGKLLGIVGTDIFTMDNSNFLNIVDYYRKSLVVKGVESPSLEQLIRCCKIVFDEYGLPCR